MASGSLQGVRAKLDRAGEHLTLLDAETAAFFDAEPIEFIGAYDPQTTEYVFRSKVHREPPPRFGVLVGDFAHNLRSALDHLVYQLVLLAGTKAGWSHQHQFPILPTSAADFAAQASTKLAGVRADHIALIEQTQPYHAREPASHKLAILNWLSNADKHHLGTGTL